MINTLKQLQNSHNSYKKCLNYCYLKDNYLKELNDNLIAILIETDIQDDVLLIPNFDMLIKISDLITLFVRQSIKFVFTLKILYQIGEIYNIYKILKSLIILMIFNTIKLLNYQFKLTQWTFNLFFVAFNLIVLFGTRTLIYDDDKNSTNRLFNYTQVEQYSHNPNYQINLNFIKNIEIKIIKIKNPKQNYILNYHQERQYQKCLNSRLILIKMKFLLEQIYTTQNLMFNPRGTNQTNNIGVMFFSKKQGVLNFKLWMSLRLQFYDLYNY